MCSDVAISVNDLTKRYRIFGHPGDRIKQALTLGRVKFNREFTALRNVSFEIKKGETVGIIGRNGSGKSTLLQLICGILKPTSGSVKVTGRVFALLELGAGFNHEFTGRENVYFLGALIGFTQAEMALRFDDIAAFADIGEFIDQPVRTYSSGMFVRLAFAVAVHVQPDVFVIDEALAVGDAQFQRKCFDRLYTLQNQGVTIVVVSHNPYQIERFCHRVIALSGGYLKGFCDAKDTLTLHHELSQEEVTGKCEPISFIREGTGEIEFTDAYLKNVDGKREDFFRTGTPLYLCAEFIAHRPMQAVRFRFEIYSANNELVALVATTGISESVVFSGARRVAFCMNPCQFVSGWYYLRVIATGGDVRLDTWYKSCEFKIVLQDKGLINLSSDQGFFVTQGVWELF